MTSLRYNDDQMLLLSGIQHFKYCPRQWALNQIDQLWSDNIYTYEGELLHQLVDNPYHRQYNTSNIEWRSVRMCSYALGLQGIADLVELHPSSTSGGLSIPGRSGRWTPFPVEYKHGSPKRDTCDMLQLTAQAICLEEMYGLNVTDGAIFYGTTRRRMAVSFTEELRAETLALANEMHRLFELRIVPTMAKSKKCNNCSLYDLCMPEISQCGSAAKYNRRNLYEETP